MDNEPSLTPQLNSDNINNIINIMLEFPPTAHRDPLTIKSFLEEKPPRELEALNQSLQFFFIKESLTFPFFEFLLLTQHIETIAKFLPWLDKVTTHKAELLEISDQFMQLMKLKKIIDRCDQLKIDKLISDTMDYDFFYSLVLLIENELDTIEHIRFLADSEQPNLLLRSYLLLKEANLLHPPYDHFISQRSEPSVSPLVKAQLLVRLKKMSY